MDFLERWSQYQSVKAVLQHEERVATGAPEFRWYEELHGAMMLNCIGNGTGAVSLMALGSYVNHSRDPSMEIQTRGIAGRNRIGFVARRDIEVGEELTISYYGTGAEMVEEATKAKVMNQFLIDESE